MFGKFPYVFHLIPFEKRCSQCHQTDNIGALPGPQLQQQQGLETKINVQNEIPLIFTVDNIILCVHETNLMLIDSWWVWGVNGTENIIGKIDVGKMLDKFS